MTAAGLLMCLAVPFAAGLGLLGGLLVLVASFADGLDGAVAMVTGKASRLGFGFAQLVRAIRREPA